MKIKLTVCLRQHLQVFKFSLLWHAETGQYEHKQASSLAFYNAQYNRFSVLSLLLIIFWSLKVPEFLVPKRVWTNFQIFIYLYSHMTCWNADVWASWYVEQSAKNKGKAQITWLLNTFSINYIVMFGKGTKNHILNNF